MSDKQIWTIGHSTHSEEEFLNMLRSFKIEILADVRKMPGSRKFPQFNQDNLEKTLPINNVEYLYLEGLGGRRKAAKESKNTVWRNMSFQAYADYMETLEFKVALNKLKTISETKRTVIMCSEAVWWRCHRSMISDALKAENWSVFHIMGTNKSTEHSYTQPARIVKGSLTYHQ